MSKGKLLVVEDEFVVAENLKTNLESMGFEVLELASSGEKALETARQKRPDLALMDIKLLGGMDGVETAIQLRQELDVPVLFLTAFTDQSFLERAKLAEPLGYLVKPYEQKTLLAGVEMAHYKARMERLLKESEYRFRSMFENSPVAYLELDELGRCLDFNSELCELLGYDCEELAGMNLAYFWPIELLHAYFTQFSKLKNQGRLQTELQLVRKDNTLLDVLFEGRAQCDMDGRLIRMHCILHNITERKRIEEERLQLTQRLQQVQKAESLARMAGAMAHHFNNKLGAITGSLELALIYFEREGSESRKWIAEAMIATNQAAEICRFMLTYLGRTTGKKEQLDLSEAVREARAILNASIPGNVHLRKEPLSRGLIIQAEGIHIKQILTNLVFNSVEAIGEAQGLITIALNVMSAEEIPKSKVFPMNWEPKEKAYACLSVTDTGPGLDPATIEKIFDPFFTTKFIGRGMGLPVVLGLIQAYEGAISVESRPGEGAVFRVYFPIPERVELPPGEEAGCLTTPGRKAYPCSR